MSTLTLIGLFSSNSVSEAMDERYDEVSETSLSEGTCIDVCRKKYSCCVEEADDIDSRRTLPSPYCCNETYTPILSGSVHKESI